MSQLTTQAPLYTDHNPLGLPDRARFSGYPVPPQHPLTQYQKDQKNADNRLGLAGGAWEATTFNPTAYVNRLLRRVGRGMVGDVDPDFVATDDVVEQYGEGLQPEYKAKLYGAMSLDDMMEMRDQYVDLQASQRKVGEGYHPIWSSLIGGVADPIYLAAGVATGGATASLGAAMGGSTLAKIAASGIVNTAVAIPIETFKASQEPTQDLSGALIDGLIGTIAIEAGGRGIGKAFGGSRKLLRLAQKDTEFAQAMDAAKTARQMVETDPSAFAHDPDFKAIVDMANLGDADRALLTKKILTPKGAEYFAEQLDPEAPARFVNQFIEESTLDPVADADQIAALRGLAQDIWDMQFRPPSAEPPNLAHLDGGPEVGAMAETAVPVEGIADALGGVGRAIGDNFYDGYFDSLAGKPGATSVFRQEPTWKTMRAAYDAGEIKSPADLKSRLAESERAGAGVAARVIAYADKLEADAKASIDKTLKEQRTTLHSIGGSAGASAQLAADLTQLAIAKAIKLGAQTAEEIARIVKQIIGEHYPLGEDMHADIVKQVEAALPDARKVAEAEAAKTPTVPPADNRPPKRLFDFFPSASDDRPGMTRVRWSRIGSFGRSKSETSNRTLSVSLFDPMAKVDRTTGSVRPSRTAGDEWRLVTETRENVAFQNTYNRALAQHMQTNPVKVKDRTLAEQAFRELLYDVHIGAKTSDDPNVMQAVAAVRQQRARILAMKQRHGLDLDITNDPHNLPRFYNVPGINTLLSKFGWVDINSKKWLSGNGQRVSQLARLIGGALKEIDGRAKLTPERRMELGEMMLRQFLKTDLPPSQRAFKVTEGLLNDMEAKLRESGKLTEAEIRDALYVASGEGAKSMQGVNPNMRQSRIDFDHTFTMELLNTQTGKMERVGISDLFDKDYEKVVSYLIHEGVSSSQEKAMLEELSRAGGRNYTKFSEVLDDIQLELHSANVSNAGIKSAIAKHKRAWDMSLGRPSNPDSGWAQFWRAVRGVNGIVGSASFGIAQVPQLGRAAATAQLRVMLKEMPDMAGLLRQFKSGNVSDEFIRWLDTITAADADSMTQTWLQRIDDRNNDAWHRINSTIDRVAGYVRAISGVEPVNRAIRRMAAAGAVNRWIDAAMSGKVPNAARLGQMGLDADDAKAIMAAITNDLKGTFEGPLKAKAMRINLNSWEPELAARFMSAINKWAQNAADRPSIGSNSDWMDTTVGKVLTQWRTFTFQGWEKQTLAAVQARDYEAMAGVSYMTMIGSLTYMAQHYLRSFTMPRDEQKEYRERYLSVGRIAAAAWQRNAFSSIMPTAYDSAQLATGGQPIFAYSNAQTTPGDLWFGNPTVQRANTLLNSALPRTFGAARGMASDALGGDGSMAGRAIAPRKGMEDWDRRFSRAWFQMAPARTAIGIQNAYDFVERQLPDPD